MSVLWVGYKSRTWFHDHELQSLVETFQVPDNCLVAQFGAFDYLMHSGACLNLKTLGERNNFFDGAQQIRHLLIPVGFTYSMSNLNKNLEKPATSDHTALIYVDLLMEKMIYYDANENDHEKFIIQKNLSSHIAKRLGVDYFEYEVCQLPTLKDGCGLVTVYAIEQILSQKVVCAEMLKEKGHDVLHAVKRRIEEANGFRIPRK